MGSLADGRLCKIDHSGPALFKYPAWAAAIGGTDFEIKSPSRAVAGLESHGKYMLRPRREAAKSR